MIVSLFLVKNVTSDLSDSLHSLTNTEQLSCDWLFRISLPVSAARDQDQGRSNSFGVWLQWRKS